MKRKGSNFLDYLCILMVLFSIMLMLSGCGDVNGTPYSAYRITTPAEVYHVCSYQTEYRADRVYITVDGQTVTLQGDLKIERDPEYLCNEAGMWKTGDPVPQR
jgi:hypothetical protein